MKKYISEFIGTMLLVIFGCGTAIGITKVTGQVSNTSFILLFVLLVSLAFGLALICIFYGIGKVSGCHINPAVSLGFWMSNKMDTRDFVSYVAFQLLGGIAGALVLALLFGGVDILGTNGYGEQSFLNVTMSTAIIVEVLLTAVFVLTVLITTQKKENTMAGIVIGFTLILVHIFGIPFTGTSVNPARSFGPALLSGGIAWRQLWIFILSPLAGSAIAAILYNVLVEEKKILKKRKS